MCITKADADFTLAVLDCALEMYLQKRVKKLNMCLFQAFKLYFIVYCSSYFINTLKIYTSIY